MSWPSYRGPSRWVEWKMRSKAGAINGQQASLGGRSLRWNVEMQIPPKTTLQWGAAQPSLWGQVRGRSWLIPTDPDGFKVIGWFGRICSNWTYSGKEQDERLLWEGSTGGREARVGDPINSGSHCFSYPAVAPYSSSSNSSSLTPL